MTLLNGSSVGKERLDKKSSKGNQYHRKLSAVSMTTRVRAVQIRPDKFDPWISAILEHKPLQLAAVANPP